MDLALQLYPEAARDRVEEQAESEEGEFAIYRYEKAEWTLVAGFSSSESWLCCSP